MKNKLLRISEVTDILQVSVPTIWRLVQQKRFPAPVKIGGSSRWPSEEVEKYLSARIEARDAGKH